MKSTIYPSEPVFEEYGMETNRSPERKLTFFDLFTGESTQDRAQQTAEQDYYRSFLAAKALQHTAALSMFEREAANLTPQSAERYRAIIDAYTIEAVKTIKEW